MMRRWRKQLQSLWRRHRHRTWVHVSSSRYRAGLILLASLVVVVYGYWWFTNDRHVRRQAEQFLREATGWQVDIRRARFRLFEGTVLEDVSVGVPIDQTQSLALSGGKILICHRPWDALLGRLRPVEVVIDQPVVTLRYDISSMTTGQDRLAALKPHGSGGQPLSGDGLVPIRIRHLTLQVIPLGGQTAQEPSQTKLNITMLPVGQTTYRVEIEQIPAGGREAMSGSLELDTMGGAVSNIGGRIPRIEDLFRVLPEQYTRWLHRYSVGGAGATFRQAPSAGGEDTYEVRMENLSLQLPPEEGGLALAEVRGLLRLGREGVTLQSITGKLPQLGQADFELSGQYGGFEANSPFALNLRIAGLAMPAVDLFTGQAREILREVHDFFRPGGRMTVAGRLSRQADGRLNTDVTIEPQGMESTFHLFPYAASDVRGRLRFDNETVFIETLTCRHGPMQATINGQVSLDGWAYDVRVQAKDCLVDEELRTATPKAFRKYYDQLGLAGASDVDFHIVRVRGEEHDKVRLALEPKGKLSLTFHRFPYRLDNAFGKIVYDAGNLQIDELQGSNGQTSCSVSGRVNQVNSDDPDVDLTVSARKVALDATLMKALPPGGKRLLGRCNATGIADRVTVQLRQSGEEPLDYTIRAKLSNGSYRLDAFPYLVEGVNGQLVIRPDQIALENFAGSHGTSDIRVDGTVGLGDEPGRTDLAVEATDVVMDEALRKALPALAGRLWDKMHPAGKADIHLTLKDRPPPVALATAPASQPASRPGEATDDYAYSVTIEPKGMEARWEAFPYVLRGLGGKVVVTQDEAVLEDLRSVDGDRTIVARGVVRQAEHATTADLAIRAENLPVSEELLAALPRSSASAVTSVLKPGGRINLNINRLNLTVPDASPESSAQSRPAAPAPGSTSASAAVSATEGLTWRLEAQAELMQVVADVGLGDQVHSGVLRGWASMSRGNLSVDVEAAIDRLQVQSRTITDLGGRLKKSPEGELLVVEDVVAKTMGGRVAGSAEIKLSSPPECDVQLKFNEIQLKELAASGGGEPGVSMEGLLSGDVSLNAKVGQPLSRRGAGELWVSKAKIRRAPVLGTTRPVSVALPEGVDFSEGVIRYELSGQNLVFREISLSGGGSSIVGSGTLQMDSERLRLVFLSNPAGQLPRIAALSDLMERLGREIIEVRVSGTLTRPLFRNVPLHSLDDVLRRLTNPERPGEP